MAWPYQASFSYEPVGPRAYPLLMLGLMGLALIYMLFRPQPTRHSEEEPPLDRQTLVKIGACVALLLVLLTLACTHRLVDARFGMVLRGCRINERRMNAMGFATLRYKLTAYVLASMLCGLAGLLYANLTGFASPAYLAWTVSGELIVMVVLGGMATVFGPLVGAITLLVSEELLKALTDHWMAILGPLIVLVVLTARRGLYGYLLDFDAWRERRRQSAKAAS